MLRTPPRIAVLCTNQAMVQDTGTYTFTATNYSGHTGVKLVVLADTEVGTALLDIKIQGKNTAENAWYDIPGASLAQISANQTASIDLVIHPAITAVANRAVSQVVPREIRVVFTLTDATTEGFTVTAELHFIP